MVTVIVTEEYGYRFWRWETGMSETELIDFWQSIESMAPHFMNPSTNMPGTWTEISHDEVHNEHTGFLLSNKGPWLAHMHVDEDSMLRDPSTDRFFYHKGKHESTES